MMNGFDHLMLRGEAARRFDARMSPDSFGQIGPSGAVEFFVSMEDINLLEAKMAELNTDVLKLQAPPPMCEPDCEAKDWLGYFFAQRDANAFKWQWTAFYLQWQEWIEDHYNHLSRLGAGPVQEFERFQRNYNELRRQFLADFGKWGAKTEAPHISEVGPDRGSGALDKVTSSVSLVAVAAIVVAGAYALKVTQ